MKLPSLKFMVPGLTLITGAFAVAVFAQVESAIPAVSVPQEPGSGRVGANGTVATIEARRVDELGDIWNSVPTQGVAVGTGTDITRQVVVEQILEPEGEYHYAAFGKPDPFLPPFEIIASLAEVSSHDKPGASVPKNVDGEEIAIISPLQTDLDRLNVIGMWQVADGSRKALISNGTTQAVVAEVGDPIGYTGRIIEIRPEGVLTRQYSLREDGAREYEDVLLLFGGSESTVDQHIGSRVLLKPGGGATIQSDKPTVNGRNANEATNSKTMVVEPEREPSMLIPADKYEIHSDVETVRKPASEPVPDSFNDNNRQPNAAFQKPVTEFARPETVSNRRK